MRHPKHDLNHLVGAEINLAPLVDVCLVLMIVLLVVVPMVRVGTASALPQGGPQDGPRDGITAKTGRVAAAGHGSRGPSVLALEQPQLAVAILADGSLIVDGRRVQPADLQKTLGEIWTMTPNRPVIIKGHRRLRYEQVRWVLQSVNAAGFRRAGLMADRAD